MADTKAPEQFPLGDTNNVREIVNLRPHPQTGRLIDNHPGRRTREMKVLCLGSSRTGTMSIMTALNQLGFRVYHMSEAMKSPRTSFGCWIEALKAKFKGQGKPFGREEFDKLMGDYDAGADVPFVTFGVELIEAYPDAKIVLNTRDVSAWLDSMDRGPGTVFRWRTWGWVAPWDTSIAGPWWDFAQWIMPTAFRTFTDFSTNGPARQAFLDHYQMIRSAAPKDRLLEYEVKQGWDPLCKFLDVPIPDEPFPRVNDSNNFLSIHEGLWYLALGKMVLKISAVAVPVVAMGWAYCNGSLQRWLA